MIVAGAGGREKSVSAHIAAKQEFAGYWEYVLDEAIYTLPAHPNWGGTAVINDRGQLIGIGSLHIEQSESADQRGHLNMVVPIDLLKPIFDDLTTLGRRRTPPRPWLGVYASEVEERVVVVGRSQRGPARKADLRNGDIIVAVAGQPISSLAAFIVASRNRVRPASKSPSPSIAKARPSNCSCHRVIARGCSRPPSALSLIRRTPILDHRAARALPSR